MPEPEETTPSEDEPQALPQVREALNRERERRTQAEAEAEAGREAARDLAFLRAGIDIDSPLGKLIRDGYTGELETEAIKSFAGGIPGALPTNGDATPDPATPPADGPTPEERAAAAAEGALSGGGVPAGQPPEKPLGLDMMDAAYATQGGNVRARPASGMSDRATAAGLQVLLNRAVAGDPQAVYKRADESWADAKLRHDRR